VDPEVEGRTGELSGKQTENSPGPPITKEISILPQYS